MSIDTRSFLYNLLGSYSENKGSGDLIFNCPFCHHHKRKLFVNVNTHQFHCWVCDAKGRTLFKILKKVNAPKKLFDALSSYYGTQKVRVEEKKTDQEITLPAEYHPMWKYTNDIEYKNAFKYLRDRNIDLKDIIRYQIGYCPSGEFAKRLIIPSYDSSGNLNYFVGRSYYDSVPIKYKNPKISKDIVGFEMFVNWKLPVILVEGVFDAIAIRRNAIPLFGKVVPRSLKDKIISERVKEVYIALDKDAIKGALKISQDFLNMGIRVYFIDPSDKDPSSSGFKSMALKIGESHPMTLRDLVKYKLFS